MIGLKRAALLAMTLDHVSVILLDGGPRPLRLIGRAAFPLFALLIAYNLTHHSRRPVRYLGRLGLFALLSQAPYAWCFLWPGDHRLNVMATLGLGLAAAWAWRERAWARPLLLISVLLIEIFEHQRGGHLVDFGAAGVLLVIATAARLQRPSLGAVTLSLAAVALLNLSLYDPLRSLESGIAALLAYEVGLWIARRPAPERGPRPSRAWRLGVYAYYPAHMLALLGVWWLIQ